MKEEETIISNQEVVDFKEFIVLIRKMNLYFQQILALPPGELSMLIMLERLQKRKDIIVASDLARTLSLSRPAVSRMLHVLEKKGYIRLEEGIRDHRLVKIKLNETGEKLIHDESEKWKKQIEHMMNKFGNEDMAKMMYYNCRFLKIVAQELGIDKEDRGTLKV